MISSVRKRQKRNEPCLSLTSPVDALPGVGPKRAGLLAELGLKTVADLLTFAPRRYLDRRSIRRIADLRPGECQTVIAQPKSGRVKQTRGKRVAIVDFEDGTGTLRCLWFGQPYILRNFREGWFYALSGVARIDRFGLTMIHPEYESIGEDLLHTARIVPLYSLKKGLSQRQIRSLIKLILEIVGGGISDLLPSSVRSDLKLCGLSDALRGIHFPSSFDDLEVARKRLALDELLLLQTLFALGRLNQKPQSEKPIPITISQLLSCLEFRLTGSQMAALEEILIGMDSDLPMRKLLQGDVGCGKTVVVGLAAVAACLKGGQVALMCPTEILAEQHHRTLSKLAQHYQIQVGLLTGSSMDRKRISSDIQNGRIGIVVGTHSLLNQDLRFRNLKLIVIDEEQRFGVLQRLNLVKKDANAHLIVVTATPIPRTLALAIYGDLDVITIDEKPPQRGIHTTRVVSQSQRQSVLDDITMRASNGEQGYFICPALSEREHGISNVERAFLELSQRLGHDKVGALTGRTDKRTREKILRDFDSKRIAIIVGTSVMEVGLDIPKATFLVVDQAERFGLSQLHQMRGRVARSSTDSLSYLIFSDSASEIARKRLAILEQTFDGFKIAEQDLLLRGPGEIMGTRQHGLPELKFARIPDDLDLMVYARENAFKMVLGGNRDGGWGEWIDAVSGVMNGKVMIV